jgi:cytoskeletal protein RodZ
MLRYASRPLNLDETIHLFVVKVLPLGIVLHLMVGLWQYGTTEIFPNESQIFKLNLFSQTSDSTSQEIVDRIKKSPLIFLILLFAVAMYAFGLFGLGLWRRIQRYAFSTHEVKENESLSTRFGTYHEEKVRMELFGPITYDIKKLPKYRRIIEAMNLMDINSDSWSKRFSILSPQK